MKYCSKCGNQLYDEAVICPKCGCMAETSSHTTYNFQNDQKKSGAFVEAIKIFMIIGTVANAWLFLLVPLAWCIPMTISYYKKTKNKEPIGTAFKICTLLFVNLVAGILMLIDDKEN